MARMVVFVATDLLYSPIKQDTKGKTTPWLPLATATIYYLSGIWHHYTVLKLDILSPRRRLVGFAFHLYDQRTRNQETSGTMPPVMRKPHRKSRNGCINCKKRKVKCDEQKPICMNCTRHELNCAYEVISRPHNSTSPVAVSPAVSGATPRSMDSQTSTLAPSPMSHGLSSCTLNMDHLELLYNFCLSTSYTLSCNEALKTLWQTSVVKVAFSCDFVMHSVLALSALHMAYLKQAQQQYHLNQAMDLHHAALSKGSPALSDVTSENCEALYLFSALTCFFALARPREPTDFLLEKNTPLSEWLLMFRGTRIVIESSNQPILHAGPLGPMFAIGGRRAQMQVASLTQIDHLWMLQRFINGTACSQEDLRVYNRAVDELRQAYNVVYNEHPEFCETTDVFLWLYRVSEDYLSLLSNRKAEALSIFAYFCVLLKRLDAKWWTQGWSTHLIAQIYQVLDAEHRLWIVWPMREIGWVP